jgi:hypothetical protein
MTDDDRISVLEHLNRIIDLRFDALDKEMSYYRLEMERRLEGLNELREDVVKDRGLLIRGDVYYPKIKTLDEGIDKVEGRISAVETSLITTAASNRNWVIGIATLVVVIELILRFWPK